VRAAWSLLGSAPDETGAGLPTEQQGSKAPGTSLPAVNPIAAAVDRASAALAAQGSVAGAAAGTGTASTVLGEPAAFLAALQSSAGEVGAETGSASGLARGLAGALDVTPASGEPVAPAGAAGLAPPRGHRPVAESVAVPVGERGWDRAFGERVVWLVGQQIHAAEVKLNPPHLGPVEVRLSLTGQDASVSFTVTHGATRDAIEQAIPRLRELFAEQQLQIVNVDVGQRDAASQSPQGDRWGRAGGASAGAPETAGAPGARPPVVVHRSGAPGLVDEYV
jgi:flagellar hook-length control protein FliK